MALAGQQTGQRWGVQRHSLCLAVGVGPMMRRLALAAQGQGGGGADASTCVARSPPRGKMGGGSGAHSVWLLGSGC